MFQNETDETYTPESGTELRVLIIEDEPTDYDLVVRQLQTAGLAFKATRVEDIHELKEELNRAVPDVILSDFTLRGFDGLAALELVREHHPDLPFILVTGTLSDVMAFDAVRKGATDYVLKDRLERLVLTVARALNEQSEKKKLRAAQHAALGILRQRQDALANFALTQTLRIVLLEDDPADVALIEAELKKSGLTYDLVSCTDEAEFRNAIAEKEPSVFLADFAVPTFDGVSAMAVRGELCPGIPFIFLSGIMGEELAIEAVKAGATDYVMKHNLPALPVAIKRAINEVQERHLRIEAEQGLQMNETTRVISDNMAAALFLVDESNRCIFANPAAERMTQYSMAELRGHTLFERLHGPLADGSMLRNHDCLLSHPQAGAGKSVRARDEMCVRKDGSFANVLYSSTDIAVNGVRSGSVIEMLDITNEKLMEQVSASTAAMNEELQALAQVVSHELQEHAGKIRSYLNLLAVRYRSHLGTDADEFIETCTNSAAIIAQMVDDLWTYARINRLDVRQEYVNAAVIAAAVVEELRERIEAVHGTVTYGKLPVVYTNPKQLAYLFRSLLDNALKFCKRVPQIKISATESGLMWIFSIEDNGIGIDPIHSKDVFKIFHRLDAKPSTAGTGMGLAICGKIVERNGGQIWFEPNATGGTTFFFSLPGHVVAKPNVGS